MLRRKRFPAQWPQAKSEVLKATNVLMLACPCDFPTPKSSNILKTHFKKLECLHWQLTNIWDIWHTHKQKQGRHKWLDIWIDTSFSSVQCSARESAAESNLSTLHHLTVHHTNTKIAVQAGFYPWLKIECYVLRLYSPTSSNINEIIMCCQARLKFVNQQKYRKPRSSHMQSSQRFCRAYTSPIDYYCWTTSSETSDARQTMNGLEQFPVKGGL